MDKKGNEKIKEDAIVLGAIIFLVIFVIVMLGFTYKIISNIWKDKLSSTIEVEYLDGSDYIYGNDLQYVIRVDGNIDKVNFSGDEEVYDVSKLNEKEILLTIRTEKIEKDQFPYTVAINYKHATLNLVIN